MRLVTRFQDQQTAATVWGDWRLGDLSDALRRACAALGPSAPANWVAIYAPNTTDALPWVQIAVEDLKALEHLRDQLDGSDLLPHAGTETRAAFQAEVDDVALHVWSREEGDE